MSLSSDSVADVVPNRGDDQLRTLSEALPVGLFLVDLGGRCIHTNARWRELTGLSLAESLGEGWARAVHPEDRDAVRDNWRHVVKSRQELVHEFRVVRPSGEVRLVRSRSGLIRAEDGEVTGFVGIDVDITERREAEDALRESEERYRSIFEATSDGLVINDPETGVVVEANPAACAMHDYTHAEFVGLHPTAFIHPSSHADFGQYVEVVRGGGLFRTRAVDVRKDGTPFHVEVLGTSLVYRGKEHLLGVVRDVTEQVEAYHLLEQRVEERTREIDRRREVAEGLRELLTVVNSKRSLEEILDFALVQAGRLLGSDAESLYLIDERDPNLLRLLASRGLPEGARTPTAPNGLPVMGLAAARRRPVVAPNFGQVIRRAPASTVEEQIVDRGSYLEVVRPGPGSAANPVQQERNRVAGRHFDSVVAIPLLAREVSYGSLVLHYRDERRPTDDELELMATFAGQAGLAIENARLHAQAEERARELDALYRADEALHRSLQVGDILNALADVAVDILRADLVSVLVWDAKHEYLIPGATRGFRPESVARMRHGPGEGVTALVAALGKPIAVEDALADPRVNHHIVDPEGIRSLLHVPIVVDEEVFGVFGVNYRSPHAFSGDEERLLQSLAQRAALALENARLYAQAEQRLRELEALYRADEALYRSLHLRDVLQALCDVAADLLRLDRTAVWTWDERRQRVVVGAAHGATAEFLESAFAMDEAPIMAETLDCEWLVVDDVRTDARLSPAIRGVTGREGVRTYLAAPIRIAGQVFGNFAVGSTQPRTFGEQDRRLVLALAQRAALAIQNARLYEQAQQAATLEERQRLARELHDSVSQALYGIALGARTARTLLDRDAPRAAEPLDYVLSLADAGLTEMRALIFELRPESLETEGLVAALTKHAAALRARHGIEVQTTLAAEPTASLEAKEALYRIAQEAMHNVVKHAKARRVDLLLETSPTKIRLEVRDDGVGFDPSGSFPGHLGLQSMRDRMIRLEGSVDIRSAPGQGTLVRAWLPL